MTADASAVVPTPGGDRARRFRQAAFVYLHVAVLEEIAAFAMVRNGVLPTGGLGPPWIWLVAGAAVSLAVVWGLLRWHNLWFARVLWVLQVFRLPTLMSGAFFRGSDSEIAPSFYLTGLVVIVINMVFLARAGWDS